MNRDGWSVAVLIGMSLFAGRSSIADEPPSKSNAAPGYRVFVVSHTHSDLCWPDSIQACLDANVAAIAKSVEIAQRVPSYRFTMEHALFLREYLRRYPDKQAGVKKLMQAGAIRDRRLLYRPLGTDLWRRRAGAATVSGQALDPGASRR